MEQRVPFGTTVSEFPSQGQLLVRSQLFESAKTPASLAPRMESRNRTDHKPSLQGQLLDDADLFSREHFPLVADQIKKNKNYKKEERG